MKKKTGCDWIFRHIILLLISFILTGSLFNLVPMWGIAPTIVHAKKASFPQNTIYLPIVTNPGVGINQPPTRLDPRTTFINSVINGQPDVVRGIYSADGLALKVEQQPAGNLMFVSVASGFITQFDLAKSFQVIGLLAHNGLAGKLFFNLNLNQSIDVIYGNGAIRSYRIIAIERFQALQPFNVDSQFVDLENGDLLSATDLFIREFTVKDQLIFQTCLSENGISSWGRFFVRAIPSGS